MALSPVTEPCDGCGGDTPHAVRIELIEKGQASKHPQFSREPYRIAACMHCGTEHVQRMNAM